MVDSISFSPVNFKGSTNLIEQYKSKNSDKTNPSTPVEKPVTASAADALSSYNKVIVKSAESSKESNTNDIEAKVIQAVEDLKPAEPTQYDLANLKAEEVKSSDGLHSYYEEKNGDISKIYNVKDGKICNALEVNNKTGNKIKEESISDNGKTSSITEYDPATGRQIKVTSFDSETGKPYFVLEKTPEVRLKSVLRDKNGQIIFAFLPDDGVDGGASVCYSFENGKLAERTVENENGVLEVNRYFEGKEISSSKPKLYPVINTTDIDYSKIDIKPSELGNVELNPDKVNGEKKYRSNGTLEKIIVNDGNLVRSYNMDYTGKKLGEIVEIENGAEKRVINMDDTKGTLRHIDELDGKGNVIKSTGFEDNIPKSVRKKSPSGDEKSTSVSFFDNGKPQTIATWKGDNIEAEFELDKSGNLIRCDEFDENNKIKNAYYNKMISSVENKTDSPENAKSVESFKKALNDPNWEQVYIKGSNLIHMKQKGVIDGLEYEMFANGTVRQYSNWGNDAIIMNSNKENADMFKLLSSAQTAIR